MDLLPLIIFGTGPVARMAYYIATYELGLKVISFAVDSYFRVDTELLGLPVLDAERLDQLYPPGAVTIFVAVGYRSMLARANAWRRIADRGWNTPSLLSPKAYVAETAILGPNCLIMPGVVIEPDVALEGNNIVWSNATICHDSIIGSDNFFAANTTIGGEAQVGSRCFFGFSSTVLQRRTVGCDILLAASALLTTDAPSFGCYKGIPARRTAEINPSLGVCVN